MRWEDERYVRLYTRDTLTWKRLGWQGRAVLPQLMRKVDRAGVLEVDDGDMGEILALMLDMPAEVTASAWVAMLQTSTVTFRDDPSRAIILPNFIEAQEARMNDAERQRKRRETARAVTRRDTMSRGVTNGHDLSHAVTSVTPSLAVPSLAKEEDLSAKPTDADLVFAEWCRVMGKVGAKFKGKRRANVLARLKDGYSVDRLCAAVRAYAADPFSMGQNDRGTKYNDLELICRDTTKVEKFENTEAAAPSNRNGSVQPAPYVHIDPQEEFKRMESQLEAELTAEIARRA